MPLPTPQAASERCQGSLRKMSALDESRALGDPSARLFQNTVSVRAPSTLIYTLLPLSNAPLAASGMSNPTNAAQSAVLDSVDTPTKTVQQLFDLTGPSHRPSFQADLS